MKLTSITKEYIRQEIEAAIPMPAIVGQYRETVKDFQAKKDSVRAQYAVMLKTIAKDISEACGGDPVYVELHFSRNEYAESCMRKRAHAAETERNIKVNQHFRRICATLELGGTKDDLEKLLEEVRRG